MSRRTYVELSRGKLREVEASAQSTITDIRAIADQIQAGGAGAVELSHLLEQAVISLQECSTVLSTLQETQEKNGMDFVDIEARPRGMCAVCEDASVSLVLGHCAVCNQAQEEEWDVYLREWFLYKDGYDAGF